LGHLGHVPPPFEKYLGHLGHGPPPLVFGNCYFKSELLAAGIEYLMYRLKYPFGLAIYYYHLLLFIVIIGLMLHIASMFDMSYTYLCDA